MNQFLLCKMKMVHSYTHK